MNQRITENTALADFISMINDATARTEKIRLDILHAGSELPKRANTLKRLQKKIDNIHPLTTICKPQPTTPTPPPTEPREPDSSVYSHTAKPDGVRPNPNAPTATPEPTQPDEEIHLPEGQTAQQRMTELKLAMTGTYRLLPEKAVRMLEKHGVNEFAITNNPGGIYRSIMHAINPVTDDPVFLSLGVGAKQAIKQLAKDSRELKALSEMI